MKTAQSVESDRRRESGPSAAHGHPGPPEDFAGGGGGEDWTLLTTAENSVVAHLIQGRLSEVGIACVLDHFDPSPGAWLKPFGDPLAPVKIYVRRSSLGQASILLHEVGHQPPDPMHEGPPVVKAMWWLTIGMIIVLTVVSLLDLFLGDRLWP